MKSRESPAVNEAGTAEPASRARAAAGLVFILAAAAIIRLPGMKSELWLDEVWSIRLARQALSASDVFLKIHHDNNNPLNTLFLHYVSASGSWPVDRLLSFVSGLAMIALLGWDPKDRARGLLAAGLAAASTPMVLYATEARGYASLALFSLACFRLLSGRTPLGQPRSVAFWSCAVLAFFSHPTFLYVFAALGVWTLVKLRQEKRLRDILMLFGPPAACMVLYELIQMSEMQFGAASRNSFVLVAFRTLSMWSGASASGAIAIIGAAALVGLVWWELANLRREGSGQFVFFASLFTAAATFVALFPFPFERHFFACLPFVISLSSDGIMRLFRRGGVCRAVATALPLLFLIGNGVRLREFSAEGRGHYLEAIHRMAADTAGDLITVGSDHDFRNGMMLEFYGSYLAPPKRIDFVPAREFRARMPEWYLLHSFSTDLRTAPIALRFSGTEKYRLIDVYRYGGLSGWMWMLYRRSPGEQS